MEIEYNVIILGGGLAGLTLALQLKQRAPEMKITILEMRKTAAPDAAHKVGESTVELGTYYLREVLGLKDYLDAHQLPKLGLRFYFSPQVKNELEKRVELGGKSQLPVPSHQIDRGLFENELVKRLINLGVDVVLGARVKKVDLDEKNGHTVHYTKDGETHQVRSHWVTDAAGRAGLLKRQLGFEKEMKHKINAVWFRVKGDVDVEQWSTDEKWLNIVETGLRRLGTIHFMGKGYWIWLIPLISGNTSVGIVADPRFHDLENINKLDKAMEWIHENEPFVGKKLEAFREDVLDFRVLKHYSHNSGRFYSTEKWGVVGDAGAFLDPFYSPGTDFISIGNTWMADLILRDYKGEDVASRAIIYERVHAAFFQSWIPIYKSQYEMWGNTQVMVVKIMWDWGVYWAIPTLLFTNNGYTNMAILRALFTSKNSLGNRLSDLNAQIQTFFIDWNKLEDEPYINYYIDFFDIPFLKKLHVNLDKQHDTEGLIRACQDNMAILEEMAAEIFRKTSERLKATPENMKVNPYKMSLKLSNEDLLEQAADKGAIDTRLAIKEDLELMWLTEKLMV